MSTIIDNQLFQTPTYQHWQKIGIYPHHGINVLLSSLYSKTSSGIGEFYDLIPLIDWMHAVGMDIIQLLPLNDSGRYFSPYNALSSLALDPIYLKLDQLPNIDFAPALRAKIQQFKHLNTTDRVEIQKVKTAKMGFLEEYVDHFYKDFLSDQSYLQFIAENSWVTEYALFCAIKDHHNNKPWEKWPSELQKITPETLCPYLKLYDRNVKFYTLIQYLAFKQMSTVKAYASKKNVYLKGDIPILVNPDSVDVWFERENFQMDYDSGCPPDEFNRKGQNWGFPVYNWDFLERNHSSWWIRRLKVASQYYHLYRIDHAVGFFRIWAIPQREKASKGFFYPQNRHLWPFEGKKHLQMLVDYSSMLPMAEDLGTIPVEVPPTLKELGIPGTKVIRWEKYLAEDDSFIKAHNYNPISMTTVSTHDTETVGIWWEKYPREAQKFAQSRNFSYTPECTRDVRMCILEDAHSTSSLFHVNLLHEYLKLFDELSYDTFEEDRINFPGTMAGLNWTYRLRASIEEIIHHKDLMATMQSLSRSPDAFSLQRIIT